MSHAPLTSFPPKWLRSNGTRAPLTAAATDIGWANPQTGEQVVAIKHGVLAGAAPYYKPNAMGHSFINPSAPPPTLVAPTSSGVTATGFTATWVAPTFSDSRTVASYSVAVTAGGTPIAGSPFAVAAGTVTKAITGLTTATAYVTTVSYTDSTGVTGSYPVLNVTTS